MQQFIGGSRGSGAGRKSGIRLPGGRYEVDAQEEDRPDALCQRCDTWGHVAPHCEAKRPKCSLCAKELTTSEHRCLVEGCRVGRGLLCPHGTAKCANYGGTHGARADACAAKREARQCARGWRTPPPQRKEQGAEGPTEAPESAEPAAQGEEVEGVPETEGVAEPGLEGMEE